MLLRLVFFFNDPATTEIYTLSLHDALPIYGARARRRPGRGRADADRRPLGLGLGGRSEEHTSELQSQSNLVCRLLLEKKNNDFLRRSIVLNALHHVTHAQVIHLLPVASLP